jgi:hypothetical protein
MPRASKSGYVIEMGISEIVALVHKSFESAVAKAVPIAVDKVVSHLVHHNSYDEFRFGSLGAVLCLQQCASK